MLYQINNEKELEKLVRNLVKDFAVGQVIGLVGDLGAGKTTLVKYIAKALGFKKIVTSPTFVILKIYPINYHQFRELVHIDAYRLVNYQNLIDIGFEDFISKSGTIIFIEWADKFPELKELPNYKECRIEIIDDRRRRLLI